MRRHVRPAVLMSTIGALGLVAAAAVFSPASAATVPVPLDCQGRPPIGSPQQIPLDASIQADAPATVAAGAGFEVTLAPDPLAIPAAAGGYPVSNLHGLTLKVPVPAGSTFVSATLTGGSNLGTGIPSASQQGGVVTVTVPGPLAAGSTVTLPVLHLSLTASGAAGSTITTSLAGTSYTDPGLAFTATVKAAGFPIDVPTSCYAHPNPTFTSTTVSAG
jgi:dehydratase